MSYINDDDLNLNEIPINSEGNLKAENILNNLRKNFSDNIRQNKIKREVNFIEKNKALLNK